MWILLAMRLYTMVDSGLHDSQHPLRHISMGQQYLTNASGMNGIKSSGGHKSFHHYPSLPPAKGGVICADILLLRVSYLLLRNEEKLPEELRHNLGR